MLEASAHETHGGRLMVAQAWEASVWLQQVWVGTAYKGAFEVEMAQQWGVEVVVVLRRGRGFVVLSQRWAWSGRLDS